MKNNNKIKLAYLDKFVRRISGKVAVYQGAIAEATWTGENWKAGRGKRGASRHPTVFSGSRKRKEAMRVILLFVCSDICMTVFYQGSQVLAGIISINLLQEDYFWCKMKREGLLVLPVNLWVRISEDPSRWKRFSERALENNGNGNWSQL